MIPHGPLINPGTWLDDLYINKFIMLCNFTLDDCFYHLLVYSLALKKLCLFAYALQAIHSVESHFSQLFLYDELPVHIILQRITIQFNILLTFIKQELCALLELLLGLLSCCRCKLGDEEEDYNDDYDNCKNILTLKFLDVVYTGSLIFNVARWLLFSDIIPQRIVLNKKLY